MDKVIRFPEITNRSKEETKNIKEEEKMKKSNIIIRFSDIAKKKALRGSGALLLGLAVFFASAPCIGHFYEPEVPEKLQGKSR